MGEDPNAWNNKHGHLQYDKSMAKTVMTNDINQFRQVGMTEHNSTEVLIIDIGNTRAKWAVVENQTVGRRGVMPTDDLLATLPEILEESDAPVSWSCVIPDLADLLSNALLKSGRQAWRLTCHDAPGLSFTTYPKPEQIGHDRIANAIGAQALVGSPAAVIDIGTAMTFDLVTMQYGFIGGIIAPGLAMMTDYLQEKVSLLPELPPENLTLGPRIGRSTIEAMSVGCTRGYLGMIQTLLEGVREEFSELGEDEPTVILTGGATRGFIREALSEYRAEPDLTLLGLAEAQLRRLASSKSG
ncbi:type III pantothenate kinase [Rubellicoccus peritrichatus]|uniref:Type III pantothenate kinase n=1 Tax=Rubellicoccus peritrichatus TaxID=3080537 RepID=A0AAQ3QTX6_9BACT|nr:type III pantothenate kinase [Puniceicoccus sp. CR14]WOO39873.1 type III pantothenate kinase [Puniceicoccus sp. CR14]